MHKFITLFFLIILNVFHVQSQTISEIPIPNMANAKLVAKSDSVVVMYTTGLNLYIRNKHATQWNQITNTPFNYVYNLSLQGTTIYLTAYTEGNPTLSGILTSSDFGATWTQKMTWSNVQLFNILTSQFCSNSTFCFWVSGYNIKRCQYSNLLVNDLLSNPLAPVGQLELINNTIYYAVDNNISSSFYGGCLGSSDGLSPFNCMTYSSVQKPLGYKNQNQAIQYDRTTGMVYATSDNGSHWNQFQTAFPVLNILSVKVIAAYGHFYLIGNDGLNDYIYFISTSNTPSIVWHFIDYIAPWDLYVSPSSSPFIIPVEVLNNGDVISNHGSLFKYNPFNHSFESFNQGIHEGTTNFATINEQHDILANFNGHNYIKYSNDTAFRYAYKPSISQNTNFYNTLSNSGNVYAYDYQSNVICRSIDSTKHFITNNVTNYLNPRGFYSKNDSVLMIFGSSCYLSLNGGTTYQSMSANPFNWLQSSISYVARNKKNSEVIFGANVSSPSGTAIEHHYTTDFGNTWNSITENPQAELLDYSIDSSKVYSISSNYYYEITDTIYQHNGTTLIAINHFTVNTGDTIVNRTFWVEDGQIFICCIYSMMGQKHLKIYRSADLTSTLTEWFSIPVNAFYYPKQSVKNCGESKLILGVVDKLYLMENNTTDTNLVSGFIYRDMNNNNVLDAFESLQQPIQLNTSSNLNLFSSNTGKFSFIESVSNDTLRAHTIPYYNCNPTYQLINAGDTGIKFRMIPLASVNDLSVKIIPQNQLIPGTVNQFQMLVKNVGTNTLYNSVVKMRRNGLLNISAIPTPFASSNDSLSWQIDSILPNQILNFTTNDHLPSQTLVGTMIPVHASVSTSVQDIELSNNRDSLSLITVNTYKGNYKHVSPTSYTVDNLSNQNALTYTIRFQNTNNFQVMNMLIIDTIEPGLDLNSLQMLSASHNYSVQLHPNRVVAFHFNNINLPDSLSHPFESSGYIQYAIQPYSTWSIGDSIRNKASIYFDVTNMTQTNTVSSVLSTTVDLNNTASNSDGIYPNPFSHEIHIQNSKGHTIELYSIDGQLILQKMIHAEHETIQLNFLCEGIYLVKNTDLDGQLISKKLIKQ